MGRFKIENTEHYGGGGGGGYFSLANDKDTARVRIMFNGIEDVGGYAVHEVNVDGRTRYVSCLREYNEPIDKCPMCAAKRAQIVKFYIPFYMVDEDTVKLWERGKKFVAKLTSLCARYPNLVSHIFEVERNGKKGDQSTMYEIYEVDEDNTTLEDLPEVPEILGGVVLDKSAEEMEHYLDYGEFPSDAGNTERTHDRRDSGVTRRTPATSRRTERRGEAF